jgi:hypothetical protein
MTEPQPNEPAEPPGRVRTYWHPLLVQIFDIDLRNAFQVREEVSVGRLPLRVDIVLSRLGGALSDAARRDLAPLLPVLNDWTLLELKGPTDSLEVGDLSHFFGCVDLFYSQQRPPLEQGTLSTAIIAPSLTAGLRADVARLGLTMQERDTAVWEITGWLFPLWILETDRLAEIADSVLAFFSRVFLQDPGRIIEHWQATGRSDILHFLYQQI